MRRSWLVLLVVGTLPVVAIPGVNAQQRPTVVNAVQLTGLPGMKENAKGKLSVEKRRLAFHIRQNKFRRNCQFDPRRGYRQGQPKSCWQDDRHS